MDDDYILQAHDLTKEFRGFSAVTGVNLSVKRNTIHVLIGPNGAGKTTVFNLLTKFLEPTGGHILYKGRDITRLGPATVAELGIVRSFQISAVFSNLTTIENVVVALQRKLGVSLHFWKSISAVNGLRGRAMELLESVNLADSADLCASELPYGSKRALEIATTLALDPELMLLDEPTQGMGHEDVGRVMELIRNVAKGRTVLMVEHNMSVVEGLSDVITVLQGGKVLVEGTYDAVSRDRRVLEAYVGVTDE